MAKFIKVTNDGFCAYGYGSNLNLKNATADKAYIKRLAKCKTYATDKDIYPGIKNPLKDDLVSLWKLGYVERYTMPKYMKKEIWGETEYNHASRIWWKTTRKGNALLKKLGI